MPDTSRFILSDWVFGFVGLVVLVAVIGVELCGGQIELELTISLLAILISVASFYLAEYRPRHVITPRLRVSSESLQWSEPDMKQKKLGWKGSWFARLEIKNTGWSTAMNCMGRLSQVKDKNGKTLERFIPLPLYWSMQDENTGFSTIDLQRRGDFCFLDIAQFGYYHHGGSEFDKQLRLRVVIPKGHRLVLDSTGLSGPELPNGVYYLCVRIYSDGAYLEPIWVELDVSNPPQELTGELGKDRIAFRQVTERSKLQMLNGTA